MAEPVNPVKRCAARQPSLLCPLTLCWLLLGVLVWPPAPTLAFELASLMVAFYGSSRTAECPASCTCTTRRAEDMLQDDVSAYLPSMGLHMNPDLESKLRASVSLLTAWLGNMNDVRCQVRISILLYYLLIMVNGSANKMILKINAIPTLSNLIAKLSLRTKWHTAYCT